MGTLCVGRGWPPRVTQSAPGGHSETGARGEDVLVAKGGVAVRRSHTH